MKRLALLLLLLSSATQAQPVRFTSDAIRDDLGRRTGAYESSCAGSLLSARERALASCLIREGTADRLKLYVDLYYSDFLTGGWRVLPSSKGFWIQNVVTQNGTRFYIDIMEVGQASYLSVYSPAEARNREESNQAFDLQVAAVGSGVTPSINYVAVGQITTALNVNLSGQTLTLTSSGRALVMTLGNKSAKLQGASVALSGRPTRIAGATYLPLSALSLLGCTSEMRAPEMNVSLTCPSGTATIKPVVFGQ